jgi:anti-sigma factor RsiW
MRPCGGRAEALSAYLDGELAPEERAELESHLPACSGCREALEELRELGEGLRAWPDVEPPGWLAAGVLQRARRAGRRPLRLLAAAASLVLVALAVVWAVREWPGEPSGGEPGAAVEPATPPRPVAGALVLPEGARVEELRVLVRREGSR